MKVFGILLTIVSLAVIPTAYSQQTPVTYIQVEGDKTNALKLLKAGGIKAETAKQGKFIVPEVKIGGNTSPFDYGDMAILTADFDSDRLPDGLVDIKFNWTVLDDGKQKKLFVADGGREVAFAVGMKPKTIVVILDVNCLFETKQNVKVVGDDGKTIDKEVIIEAVASSPRPLFSQVIVGSEPLPPPPPPPPPPPDPNPNPTPTPVLPDGRFGLAKFIYNSLVADVNMTSDEKGRMAQALASGFGGIASKIDALREYTDVATILADTKKANDTALSESNIDASRSRQLMLAVKKKVNDLYQAQQLNTAQDIKVAWRELSQGFTAFKNR